MSDYRDNINDCIYGIANGDKSALAELYRLLRLRLTVVACAHLRNKSDAADAVQETFVKVARKAASFRGDSGAAWVERICRNVCLDTLRKRKRLLSDVKIESVADPADGDECILQRIGIHNALRKLSPKEFAVIRDAYFFGLNFKEVAHNAGLSLSAVYKIHGKALSKLKELLK